MAGHSKWANVKHRKERQDAKRGKIFTKLIREITVAAKLGGGDANSNPRLRAAIEDALAQNMTRDTINRAIQRGAGGLEGAHVEEVMYEGYGVAGVAVMVECLTDNRHRTVAEIRHAFTKYGGHLGTDGSVSYLFTKQGELNFSAGSHEEKIMEVALALGAEDVATHSDGSIDVMTAPERFDAIKEAMLAVGLVPESAQITLSALTQVVLGKEDAEKMMHLVDSLEELDDVQHVYTNADIPEDVLKSL